MASATPLFSLLISQTVGNNFHYRFPITLFTQIERFTLSVQEDGTTVNEELEVDLEEQTEVIRVPKHNDVDASDVLNDFANVRILFFIQFAFTQVAFVLVH